MNLLPVAAAHLALPMPGTRKLALEGLPPRRRLVPVGARLSHGARRESMAAAAALGFSVEETAAVVLEPPTAALERFARTLARLRPPRPISPDPRPHRNAKGGLNDRPSRSSKTRGRRFDPCRPCLRNVRLLQMRPNEVVDLAARDLALESTDDTPVFHQDERRGARDAEPGHESRVTIRVELEHGETTLLGDLHPRHEALHAPRCTRAVSPNEYQRRPSCSRRRERLRGLGRRLHAQGVPSAVIRETLRAFRHPNGREFSHSATRRSK